MTRAFATRARMVKYEAAARGGMVATKDRLATEAGLEMLRAGGNAVDAAVAACLAVGVVEPASSGIGGGGYLVYQVEGRGGVVGFPMRAPGVARPDMYPLTGQAAVGSFGWPGVANDENIEGPRSIAVPGAVAGLCKAHEMLGRLPLRDVVAPAVRLAREGFVPNWFCIHSIGTQAGKLARCAETIGVFLPGGRVPSGDLVSPPVLRQPDLANTLEAIGRGGADAYYRGDIARALASGVQDAGGILSAQDLADYRPFVWDKGLELTYRGFTVRVPPFACAGPTSAMTLKLVRGFDMSSLGRNTVEMLHAYVMCARLAYADRFAFMADPDFVEVPWSGLMSDAYADRRRATIGGLAPADVAPGDPWVEEGRRPRQVLGASRPALDTGTTHLCVMDGDGNAVSLTNTLMSAFGSGFMAKGTGVTLNNGMMWFDPVPGRVNSVEAGKHPLNNMTPTLVLDDRGVKLAVGASGGRRITNCVTQLVIKMLDFGMGPQAAIDSPRVDASTPWTSADPRLGHAALAALERRGHRIRPIAEGVLESGFQSFASPVAILRDDERGCRAGVDTFHSAYAAGL